jgi:hypothetical protein
MELSVRKRINGILGNQQRIMELAGVDGQYSASDPEAGVTAPANAYEDNWNGLQKRFGKDILEKIEMFVESNMNMQMAQSAVQGTDIVLKKSPSPNTSQSPDQNINQSTDLFIRFGGYMQDAKNYAFSVGFKNNIGAEVFAFRFVMDINGNLNNWQSTSFGS